MNKRSDDKMDGRKWFLTQQKHSSMVLTSRIDQNFMDLYWTIKIEIATENRTPKLRVWRSNGWSQMVQDPTIT